MKPRRIITVVVMLAAPVWAQTELISTSPVSPVISESEAPQVISETCLNQDKLPCVLATTYLREPDGSNATKIVLAHVVTEQMTNSRGQHYYHSGIMQGEFKEIGPGYASLPAGESIILRQGAMPPNRPQIVSIERLKPTAKSPRSYRSGPPTVMITSPCETLTSQPMIDLTGSSDQPLQSVRFDVINAFHRIEDQAGFVTDSYFDTLLWQDTTNYWKCLDVALAPGTNKIAVRCQDFEGRVVTTNLTYVLRFNQDKTPPQVSITWPTPGRQVSGDKFTVRGLIDDKTSHVVGQVSAAGRTNVVEGLVERTGRFWVEHLPLLGKSNLLTLTATDAAGNVSVANVSVVRSEAVLSIDPVPASQLWQLQVQVTGKVSPPDQEVWVNDRKAEVASNGVWTATGIPLTQEGVALFKATAIPKKFVSASAVVAVVESDSSIKPMESVSMQTSFSARGLILNTTQPTYGAFNLRLTGVAGSSFVLCASTNLVDWTPILTNLNSAATFDYADTNTSAYGCRFFRIIPTQ